MTDIIEVPDFCMVLMIGPPGAGKSAFAHTHFDASEILTLDHFLLSSDDEGQDVEARERGLDAMRDRAADRLSARQLTVIDATNIHAKERGRFIKVARTYFAKTVGFAFDFDADMYPEPREGLLGHIDGLRRILSSLKGPKSIKELHILRSPEDVAAISEIKRKPLSVDLRNEAGPFDIIGDIHGCADELETLLTKLGYQLSFSGEPGERSYEVKPPFGRRAIFLGDLVDRGPRSPDVLRLVKSMMEAGTAYCVIGNHEFRLYRKLGGQPMRVTHGLEETLEQFAEQPNGFSAEMEGFLQALPSHLVFDGGDLVVAHAGLKEEMHNRKSGKVRSFAMYGDTDGKTDSYGLPVRRDWAADYSGKAAVVYGHTPVAEARWKNNTICIDTGCVFGGKLTALRWPERELVDVPAEKEWFAHSQPIK